MILEKDIENFFYRYNEIETSFTEEQKEDYFYEIQKLEFSIEDYLFSNSEFILNNFELHGGMVFINPNLHIHILKDSIEFEYLKSNGRVDIYVLIENVSFKQITDFLNSLSEALTYMKPDPENRIKLYFKGERK